MTRLRRLLLPLAAVAVAGCSGSTPRDMYFGTDAGANFEVPIAEITPEAPETGDTATDDGAAGAGGAAGSGAAGAGGAAGSDTAGTGGGGAGGATADAATDGDASATPSGQ